MASAPQTANRYAYALANPLRYTDPSGHFVNNVLLNPRAWYTIMMVSISIAFPVVGIGLGLASGISGVDMFTGESLSPEARALYIGGSLLAGGIAVVGWLRALPAAGETLTLAEQAFRAERLAVNGALRAESRLAGEAGELADNFVSGAESLLGTRPSGMARAITNERPVTFDRPLGGSTAAQDAQIRAHVEICNEAYCAGALSSTGRVSTQGNLVRQAGRAAAGERAAHPDLYPNGVVAGHGPDTTWTGNPIPFRWQPLDRSVNASLGAQAQRYALGYKPTGFWFIDDYLTQFGALPGQ